MVVMSVPGLKDVLKSSLQSIKAAVLPIVQESNGQTSSSSYTPPVTRSRQSAVAGGMIGKEDGLLMTSKNQFSLQHEKDRKGGMLCSRTFCCWFLLPLLLLGILPLLWCKFIGEGW